MYIYIYTYIHTYNNKQTNNNNNNDNDNNTNNNVYTYPLRSFFYTICHHDRTSKVGPHICAESAPARRCRGASHPRAPPTPVFIYIYVYIYIYIYIYTHYIRCIYIYIYIYIYILSTPLFLTKCCKQRNNENRPNTYPSIRPPCFSQENMVKEKTTKKTTEYLTPVFRPNIPVLPEAGTSAATATSSSSI